MIEELLVIKREHTLRPGGDGERKPDGKDAAA